MKSLFFTFAVLMSVFVQANIRSDVEFLASDAMNGRAVGTQENRLAQAWLIERLTSAGVRPAGDWARIGFTNNFEARSSFVDPQSLIKGTNLIGILYPKNIWTDEVPKVMLGAHYDHVTQCQQKFGNTDTTCNGAADNAASVAVLLSMLEELSQTIEQPVAIAFWDAEEVGLVGSNAYFQAPTMDLTQMRLYINLDVVGLNLFRGLEGHHFLLGSETGGAGLQNLVSEVVDNQTATQFHRMSYAFGHRRSDMSSLIQNGLRIPFLFFSDGDGPIYHSNSDEARHLNYSKLEAIAATIQSLTVATARFDQAAFVYHAPVIDPASGYAFPYYADVSQVSDLYDRVINLANDNQLDAATQTKLAEIRMMLRSLETKSEATITPIERLRLLQAIGYLTQTSRGLTFIP
jgi:hypothetical protein